MFDTLHAYLFIPDMKEAKDREKVLSLLAPFHVKVCFDEKYPVADVSYNRKKVKEDQLKMAILIGGYHLID
jgi:hypothetical protein